MSNKIVRGTTGQATITTFGYISSGWSGFPHIEIHASDGTYMAYTPYGLDNSFGHMNGWDATDTGVISVPAGTPLDSYYGQYGRYNVPFNPNGNFGEVGIRFAFDVVCMSVAVSITKLSSAPVPGSSPIQYEHKYTVEALAHGGIDPKTYTWTTSVGSISASGPSGILAVTNSYANYGNVNGTVTCNVASSDVPPCYASDSALIENGNPTIEGWQICISDGDSKKKCDCKSGGSSNRCEAEDCVQATSNLTISSLNSDPANYKSYARGSGNSQAPNMGIAKH